MQCTECDSGSEYEEENLHESCERRKRIRARTSGEADLKTMERGLCCIASFVPLRIIYKIKIPYRKKMQNSNIIRIHVKYRFGSNIYEHLLHVRAYHEI